MKSLMFLDSFVQKLLKKNLWGVGSTKGKVKREAVRNLFQIKQKWLNVGPKLQLESVIFPLKSGVFVPILLWKDRILFLHIFDPNYPFLSKMSTNYQKSYNFDIFPTLPQICTSLLPNFAENLKFYYTPLCRIYY